ncbi:hypothetical protein GGE65_000776 [Skermanella aerolata]|uniref:hypothetical protein n=1 Tax=Skermanella aerolata TaxID=393310 RepID=UPI003D1A043E
MPALLLPQQPAPVTRRDAALTARFLLPAIDALTDFLLTLRAGTDRELGATIAVNYGKPYPSGYCQEITQDVMSRLGSVLATSDHRGARALNAFLSAGGVGRCVWGVLRGRYFQTALQFGGLYVDVANDTVTVTKPKVEILPMEQAGLEAVSSAAHFADIAEKYWGMRIYANHALPSLAPLLPMIGIIPGHAPALQSATGYMTGLFRRDGFRQAEAWLAQGAAPSEAMIEELRARCSEAMLAADPCPGMEAALSACRSARAAGSAGSKQWCDDRLNDYQQIHRTAANAPATGSPPAALTIARQSGGPDSARRHAR